MPLCSAFSKLNGIIRLKNCSSSSNFYIVQNVARTVLISRLFSADSQQNPTAKEDDALKIDLNAINDRVEADLAKAKAGKETELDKTFINFTSKRTIKNSDVGFSALFTWKYFAVFSSLLGSMLVILFITWKIKADERERNRKRTIGKAKIGGEWQLTNMDGQPEGSKDLLGKWQLIYFGFTNCPDICPDEIEKMVDVVDILDREEKPTPIIPIFISVDPERDTVERVKKYCAEFSPKLRGYTGTKEQVKVVTKAFRIYHSEGPRNAKNTDDYIVDHTVLMYLVDPEGQFHDYYGQNRRAQEIAGVIKKKIQLWDLQKRRENSWLNQLMRRKEEAKLKEHVS